MPQFFVHTFGCQMNVHDSERMEALLRAHGWRAAASADDADAIIFNACSVREKAEQKLRSEVGRWAPVKKKRPGLVLAVTGCVAQQEGAELLKRIPHLDLVVGPDNLAELPELIVDQMGGSPPTVRASFDTDAPRFLPAAIDTHATAPPSVYVTTMKGCDERCSFCIVPYTRGPERYRPAGEIVDEVARWVDAGAREVTLLGQTVDSYRDASLPLEPCDAGEPAGDSSQFPALLRRIAHDVPRLARLRYTSPHPRHATRALVRAHAELDVLAPHVHLPVQSGSDRILRRMIRRYTRAEYVDRARRLQSARAGLTLSTDIIVGFPGETEDDFAATLDLVREVGFVSLFAFKFSPRPHTPARKLADDVPEAAKRDRLARLLETAEAQQRAHLAALVGTRQHVLLVGRSRGAGDALSPNACEGRTERSEIVHVHGCEHVGEIVEVTIRRAHKHSLAGELTEDARSRLPPRPDASRRRSLAIVVEATRDTSRAP